MRRAVAVVALVVLFSGVLEAQTKAPSNVPPPKRVSGAKVSPTATPSPAPVATPSPYVDAPLDTALPNLPPRYFGASIQHLISATAQPSRGEFETTAQYEARSGKTSGGGIYAFLLGEGSRSFFKYDADAVAFNLTVFPDFGVHIGYKSDYRTQALIVSEIATSRREYEASNAFGAKATVSSNHKSTVALIPSNWVGYGARKISISVPVPLEEAPSVKKALGALAIFRFSGSADAIASGTYVISATIDAPTEIFTEYKYLRGELLSIWVYNIESGKIYTKTPQ